MFIRNGSVSLWSCLWLPAEILQGSVFCLIMLLLDGGMGLPLSLTKTCIGEELEEAYMFGSVLFSKQPPYVCSKEHIDPEVRK